MEFKLSTIAEVSTILNECEISKNNQQIAHDLRSPLSALNFVSSLNPNLPDASRELLAMAITRLQEIANKLDNDTRR